MKTRLRFESPAYLRDEFDRNGWKETKIAFCTNEFGTWYTWFD